MSNDAGAASDESYSDGNEASFVPHSAREEWRDVQGIPQDEGPNPVARIAYTDKFADVFNYFRAIVASGEVSQRALELTKEAAELNPANYSVWHHRRHLLKALKADLTVEMAYCRAVIEDNPKNYQVWQHRRALVEWTKDPSKELRFTEIILAQDAKNYHAWQHRQWVIQTYALFADELNYVNKLLETDVRNNSAWNQRFFVITSSKNVESKAIGGGDLVLSGQLLSDEIDFTCKAIAAVPGNESAWNYLRGLIEHAEESLAEGIKAKVSEFCENLQNDQDDRHLTLSPYLLAMLVDLYKESGDEARIKKSLEICNELASKHDVIRKEYWEHMAKEVQPMMNAAAVAAQR